MKYIFYAETSTEPDMLRDELNDFLNRMLQIDTEKMDKEVLDFILSGMEVLVDVDEKRVILIYEDEKGNSESTYGSY